MPRPDREPDWAAVHEAIEYWTRTCDAYAKGIVVLTQYNQIAAECRRRLFQALAE